MEPAAAVGLAALRARAASRTASLPENGTVVLVLSGGNADLRRLGSEDGMAA